VPTAAHRLLCEAFLARHPPEAAHVLERLPAEDVAFFLATVPAESAAGTLAVMLPGAAAACLEAMDVATATAVVALQAPRTAAVLVRRLGAERRSALLARLPAPVATPLETLLRHPPDTAGALLEPHALALPADTSAAEAREALARAGREASCYVWVVRRDRTLAGVVALETLMPAAADRSLGDVMQPVASLPASADPRTIVAHPGWREWHALPVVDRDDVLLGVIGYETLRRLEADLEGGPAHNVLADVITIAEAYLVGMTELMKGLAGPADRRGASHGS
jgi:magnesium transporter